jgi:hypothetical protein
VANEIETLRWPTNLNRAAIEERLGQVLESARAGGLEHLVSLFTDLKKQSAAQLGSHVVAALNWLQDKPQHRALTTKLEMVALNLKNLK